MFSKVVKRLLRGSVFACGLNYLASGKNASGNSFAMLCYHRVLEQPDPWYRFSITVEQFKKQLAFLSRFCHVLPLGETVARLEAEGKLPARCVVLTFDDGYRDLYTHVWPLLKRYGLAATAFISVGAIEQKWLWPDLVRHALRTTNQTALSLEGAGPFKAPLENTAQRLSAVEKLDAYLKKLPHNQKETAIDAMLKQLLACGRGDIRLPGLMLSWDELKQMSSEGFSIGAHSMTHPILTRMPPAQASDEISQSRKRLQQNLGAAIEHFCYPNGTAEDFSPDIEALVRQAGFRSACTTLHGLNQPSQNRFALRRIGTTHDCLRTFIRVLEEASV